MIVINLLDLDFELGSFCRASAQFWGVDCLRGREWDSSLSLLEVMLCKNDSEQVLSMRFTPYRGVTCCLLRQCLCLMDHWPWLRSMQCTSPFAVLVSGWYFGPSSTMSPDRTGGPPRSVFMKQFCSTEKPCCCTLRVSEMWTWENASCVDNEEQDRTTTGIKGQLRLWPETLKTFYFLAHW